jgi:hypothetical protein
VNGGEATAIGSLLSFSIFGLNRDGKFVVPGTGFRVHAGVALTAKHVASEIFQQLGLRENERWPRGLKKKFESMTVRAAEQDIGRDSNDSSPWWWVDGVVGSKTDIAILVLSPGNDAAVAADQRGMFLRWSLDPPRLGQQLWAFGYAEKEHTLLIDDSQTNFEIRYEASAEPLRVERVLEQGRREDVLDIPSFLGSNDPWSTDMGSMPCFEVEGILSPSMSGGPVFNGDRLYGVVSTGLTYQEHDGPPLKPYGRVALLRPLLEMNEFALDDDKPPISIAGLIRSGQISSVT